MGQSPAAGCRESLSVIPGKPIARRLGHLLGVLLQGHEVVEGVDPVEFAGVDQAHMDVAHPGPRKRFIGQRVFAVEDGRLEPPLRDVMPTPGLCRVAA